MNRIEVKNLNIKELNSPKNNNKTKEKKKKREPLQLYLQLFLEVLQAVA